MVDISKKKRKEKRRRRGEKSHFVFVSLFFRWPDCGREASEASCNNRYYYGLCFLGLFSKGNLLAL